MATSISTTLAAGAVSPYFFDVIITKQLCQKTCASKEPIFTPTFTLVSYASVGTNMYEATVNVQGVISYIPCGSCDCAIKQQLVNENFILPVYSATAITAMAVSGGNISNEIQTSGCSKCGNTMRSDNYLSLTVTTS